MNIKYILVLVLLGLIFLMMLTNTSAEADEGNVRFTYIEELNDSSYYVGYGDSIAINITNYDSPNYWFVISIFIQDTSDNYYQIGEKPVFNISTGDFINITFYWYLPMGLSQGWYDIEYYLTNLSASYTYHLYESSIYIYQRESPKIDSINTLVYNHYYNDWYIWLNLSLELPNAINYGYIDYKIDPNIQGFDNPMPIHWQVYLESKDSLGNIRNSLVSIHDISGINSGNNKDISYIYFSSIFSSLFPYEDIYQISIQLVEKDALIIYHSAIYSDRTIHYEKPSIFLNNYIANTIYNRDVVSIKFEARDDCGLIQVRFYLDGNVDKIFNVNYR